MMDDGWMNEGMKGAIVVPYRCRKHENFISGRLSSHLSSDDIFGLILRVCF